MWNEFAAGWTFYIHLWALTSPLDGYKIAAIKPSASIGSYVSLSYNPTYRDATVHLVFLAALRHSCFNPSGNFWALTRRKEITGTIALSSATSDFFFNIPSIPGVFMPSCILSGPVSYFGTGMVAKHSVLSSCSGLSTLRHAFMADY